MRAPRVLSICMIAFLCSCGTPEEKADQTYDTAADQLIAEFDGKVDKKAVDKVLELSKKITLDWRSKGITNYITTLKAQLKGMGKECKKLDDIEDFTIGQVLPGLEDWDLAPKDSTTTSVTYALKDDNPNKKYEKCPPIAQKGDLSCVLIVDTAALMAQKNISPSAIQAAVDNMLDADALLKDEDKKFKDYAKSYLSNLATQIHKYGIDVATVRAEYTMRKEGVCDNKVIDGKEIAKLRGIEDATIVLRRLVGLKDFEVRPKGSECLKLGSAGTATNSKIDKEIKKYVEDVKKDSTKAFCSDMSNTNPNVIAIYKAFEDGLKRGVKAQLATVWIGTFRNGRPWRIKGKVIVVKIDGCHAKDQIKYTTSPLVLDLDRDGLDLTTTRVEFDLRATGQVQKVTWAGKREGFLALDSNNDGRITSGRELFGNHTLCGLETCSDGAVALAMHDGNKDGRIDSGDAVFWSLQVWVDANGDGESSASELKTLADHGITAISLKATPMNKQVEGGKISLSLKVEAKGGAMTAYDVWFHNNASPGFRAPLH